MIDEELRALLSSHPSPGFEARVRDRISADRPGARWRAVLPGLAIAATLLIALAGGVLPRIARQATAPQALLRAQDAGPMVTPLRAPVAPASGAMQL